MANIQHSTLKKALCYIVKNKKTNGSVLQKRKKKNNNTHLMNIIHKIKRK